MATEFLMPKLGLTMEEGTILQWLLADNAQIEPGTAVMVIETDKVESEVEANASGRLHRLAEEGQTFRCGEVIGWLLAEGETAPARAAAVETVAAAVRQFVSPNARRLAAERNIDLAAVRGSGPDGRIVSQDLDQAPVRPAAPARPFTASPVQTDPTGWVPASVAARQLADLLGIDLALVPADPVDRYVTREAIARYVRERLRQPVAVAPAVPAQGVLAPATQTPTATRRLTGMRGTIAKRMFASIQEMAQLTLTMDATMDAVASDRMARRTSGPAPSYTDYVIAAVARALRIHPIVNSQVTSDGIALLPEIHVGLAVALDEGLMVPVVRHADRLGIAELASTTTRLAAAARSGQLTLQELEGGTFSVSALGAFGVDSFTPVINPPNTAILGVGRVRDDLVLNAGVVETTKRMTLSLTWDHRVFDGVPAAQFCKAVVDLLSDPQQFD